MVIAFVDEEQQLERPEAEDEMGFSLTVGRSVGRRLDWVRQPPIASYGRKADLGIQQVDEREVGHAVLTLDVDGDDRTDLVVGAPLDGEQGRVLWFDDMGTAAEGIALNAPGARSAGMAMTSDATRLIIGAPGGPAAPGQVIMLSLPL